MSSVIRERQITEEEQEMLELEELAPDKFDPEITFKVNKQASNHSSSEQRYHPLTREETAWLMAASNSPYEQEESEFPPTQYPTLSREECERLVREHYEYKEREKIKRDKLWASSKTTELEVKTKNTKKHTKSTKA